jgi:hypothetical protein
MPRDSGATNQTAERAGLAGPIPEAGGLRLSFKIDYVVGNE